MALAIDGSSPATATQTNAAIATVASASFTPPDGSLLLVLWSCDQLTGGISAPTITDSLGTHLTYTQTDWVSLADSPNAHGQAAAWTAPVGTGAAMTVTVTTGSVSGERISALRVLVITGQDTVTPVGAHGKAGSVSAAAIAQNYTAQSTNGWGFIADCDFDQKGAQTAGTGCTLIDSANVGTAITYGFVRRTSADDVNGNTNTLNVTLPGTSANLNWVYVEINPAAAAATSAGVASQPLPPWLIYRLALRAQTLIAANTQSDVPPPAPIWVAAQRAIYPNAAVLIGAAQFPSVTLAAPPAVTVAQSTPPKAPPPIVAITPPLLPPQAIPVAPIWVTTQAQIPPPRPVQLSPAQIVSTAILPLTVTVVAQQFRPAVVAPIALAPPLLAPPAPTAMVVVVGQRYPQPSVTPVTVTPSPLPQPPAPITVVPAQGQRPLAVVITLVPSPLPQALPPIVVVTSTWRPGQPQIVVSQPSLPTTAILTAPPLVVPTFTLPAGTAPRMSQASFLPGPAMPAAVLVVGAYRQPAPEPVLAGGGMFLAGANCQLPRPDVGDTLRPTGTTTRPTGTTSRPGSGLTVRPDTGDTDNPC